MDLAHHWSGPERELDRLIDDAIASGIVDVAALIRCTDRAVPPSAPGRRHLVALWAKRGGRFVAPDSELEAVGLAAFEAWHCPPPQRQFELPGRAVPGSGAKGRVDFAWPDRRVVIELDGRRWHAGEAAFENDRLRDRAVAAAGWRSARFTWSDFHGRRRTTRVEVRRLLGLE